MLNKVLIGSDGYAYKLADDGKSFLKLDQNKMGQRFIQYPQAAPYVDPAHPGFAPMLQEIAKRAEEKGVGWKIQITAPSGIAYTAGANQNGLVVEVIAGGAQYPFTQLALQLSEFGRITL